MEQWRMEEQAAEETFRLMLHTVSRKSTKQEKKMLQVLLRNTLGTLSEVQGAKSVLSLLHMLKREGHLTRSNLNILYECIKLTNAYHLQDEIRKYYSCPDIRNHEIRLIPKERQAIMACGKALTEEEINELDHFYGFNDYQRCDVWDFLVKLENKFDISRDKTKMDKFMSNLKKLEIKRPLKEMESILKDKRPAERTILNERPAEMSREIETEKHQKGKRRLVGNAPSLIEDHFQQRKSNQPTMVLRSNCPVNGLCTYAKKPRVSEAHDDKENISPV